MAEVYGQRPPWHDVQAEIRGPAVGDVETVFRERWNDPTELSRHPGRRLRDMLDRRKSKPGRLPRRMPDPPPDPEPAAEDDAQSQHVQILRTYPRRRGAPYPFAPRGERSIARGYLKALKRARHLIYVEDQYLWSAEVVHPFAQALRDNPTLHMIAVVPWQPDSPSRAVAEAQGLGRYTALNALRQAGGDRVATYGIENAHGTPIYVHAKVCVIDDTWATVGSDNFNLRSWTYDSELTCAVFDQTRGQGFPRQLRLALQREHLGQDDDDNGDLEDPMRAFAAFAKCAKDLDSWHDNGSQGARPPGQLRRYHPPELPAWRTPLARILYRVVCDPDGRPTSMRLRNRF
jgi:phosphatidylserine/phosphatidylglycerophosphate/cardiolipin synthase-like enzyme